MGKALLLDTHVFLWAAGDPAALSVSARNAIEDLENDVFVSAAVAWEMTIKYALGKLELPMDPVTYFPARVASLGFKPLAIESEHALAIGRLPNHHNDSFDRIMIAQAQVAGLTLVTADRVIARYPVHTLAA